MAYQINNELYYLCQIYAVNIEIEVEFNKPPKWSSCEDSKSCKECEQEVNDMQVHFLKPLIKTKGDRLSD